MLGRLKLDDIASGIVLLAASLLVLSICLVCLVKVLNSMLK